MSSRLLWRRSSKTDFYPFTLRAILHDGQRIWDPSYAGSQDPEVWEKAMLNAVVSGAIDRNLVGIAGTECDLEPASEDPVDEQLADILSEIILSGNIHKFAQARKDLAVAKFQGSSFAWVTGKEKFVRVNETTRRNWYVPSDLKDIDRRRFRYISRKNENGTWRFVPEFFSTTSEPAWQAVDFLRSPFIRRIYANQESRLGYGRGIMDSIYITTYAWDKVEKNGLQGLSRWAQGMLVGKLDSAKTGDPTVTNETRRDNFKTVLLEHVGDNVIIIDAADDVELKEASGTGHEMVEKMLNRLERQLVTRIEGTPITIMDGEGGGAKALGAEHGQREHAQQTFDREDLAEDLDQLVRIVYERNLPTLREVNPALAEAQLPKFAIRHAKDENPAEVAQMFKVILESGVEVSAEEYRERVGIRAIEEGEAVIKAKAPPQQNGFGSPFGGGGSPFFPDMNPQPEAPEVPQPVAAMAGTFDESKVKRDAGKFSKTDRPGGEKDEGGEKSGGPALDSSVARGVPKRILGTVADALRRGDEERLDLFRKVAPGNGIDAEAVIEYLRGGGKLDVNVHDIGGAKYVEPGAIDQIDPDDTIWVFHGTTDDSAESILRDGVSPPDERAHNGTREGLYVAGDPTASASYGGTMLAIPVRAGDVMPGDASRGWTDSGLQAAFEFRDAFIPSDLKWRGDPVLLPSSEVSKVEREGTSTFEDLLRTAVAGQPASALALPTPASTAPSAPKRTRVIQNIERDANGMIARVVEEHEDIRKRVVKAVERDDDGRALRIVEETEDA